MLSLKRIFIGSVKQGVAVVSLWAAAKLSLPLEPVPFTLSTYALILILFLLSRYESLLSVGLYLILGFLDVLSFSKGKSGAAAFLGPTGGYLIGFFLATFLLTRHQKQNPLPQTPLSTLCSAFLTGLYLHAIILISGVSQLAMFLGVWGALQKGFVSFLLPAFIKSALAALTLVALQEIQKKRRKNAG